MTLGMICPKSWHESLAQVGSARGPLTGQPPPRARRAAEPGQGRRLPCRAACDTWRGARWTPGSWTWREVATQGLGVPWEAFLSFPSMSGQQAWNPRKRQLQPLAPWLTLSGWTAACLVVSGPTPHEAARRRGGRGRGNGSGARLGGGAWRREKGNRPFALFSAKSLTRGGPLQGSPRPGP